MSEDRTLLADSANRLFGDLAADPGLEFADAWAGIAENGFPWLLVPEAQGGFGGDWLDAAAVLRLAGYHALALPLAETILANRLRSNAGLTPLDGVALMAERATGGIANGRFSGTVQVAWGRHAASIVAAVEGSLIRLDCSAGSLREATSPAGEPRDTLTFDNAPAEIASWTADPFLLGAFARTAAIAGALDGALERSIAYANERIQFGKPIGKFQAVQQSLAVFAEEAAAVNCAAQAAARALDRGNDVTFEIAAAKLRANRAAQTGAAIAHQTHGAIGFTQEYGLHRWTRRLLAWASDYGAEALWAHNLGAQVAKIGPQRLWADITKRAER